MKNLEVKNLEVKNLEAKNLEVKNLEVKNLPDPPLFILIYPRKLFLEVPGSERKGARRAFWAPNSNTTTGLSRPSRAGQRGAWAEIDGWRTLIGLLRPSRGYDRAALWRE